MAIIELSYFSQCLAKHTRVTVLLPMAVEDVGKCQKYKTLWLLHGMTGNNQTCLHNMALAPVSEKYNLAIVLPDADLSFYVNMRYGADYFDFIADELPAYLRALLPLSHQKRDNFVAGISMGGYGAFLHALNHPERYAAAVSFAGPMDIQDIARTLIDDRIMNAPMKALLGEDPAAFEARVREFSIANDIPLEMIRTLVKNDNLRENRTFKAMYGQNPTIDGTREDIFSLAAGLERSGLPLRLLALCGTEDFHHPSNLRFKAFAGQLGLDYEFIEGPGGHTWEFWNPRFENAVRWMLGMASVRR